MFSIFYLDRLLGYFCHVSALRTVFTSTRSACLYLRGFGSLAQFSLSYSIGWFGAVNVSQGELVSGGSLDHVLVHSRKLVLGEQILRQTKFMLLVYDTGYDVLIASFSFGYEAGNSAGLAMATHSLFLDGHPPFCRSWIGVLVYGLQNKEIPKYVVDHHKPIKCTLSYMSIDLAWHKTV